MIFEKIKHNREYIYLFLIYLFFISFVLSKAINSILGVFFIVLFFIDTKKNLTIKFLKIISNKILLFYILFFFIQILGVFYSSNRNIAIRQVEILLPALYLPIILSVELINKNQFNKLINLLSRTILLIFIILLLIHLFYDHKDFNSFVLFSVNEKIGTSQVFISYILLIPFLMSLTKINDKTKVVINSIMLLISMLFLLLLGNKTLLAFLIIFIIFKLFSVMKMNKKISLYLFIFSLFFSFSAYQLPIVKTKINIILRTTDLDLKTIITKNKFTFTKNTLEHRILINHLALLEIKKSLPFGVGTGDFQEKLDTQYKRVHFKLGMKYHLNNHNQYLAEFLKTGILGGGVYILLLILIFKQSIKFQNFAFPIVLLFVLGNLTESYLSRQHGVAVFAFFIPFFLWNEPTINKK